MCPPVAEGYQDGEYNLSWVDQYLDSDAVL